MYFASRIPIETPSIGIDGNERRAEEPSEKIIAAAKRRGK